MNNKIIAFVVLVVVIAGGWYMLRNMGTDDSSATGTFEAGSPESTQSDTDMGSTQAGVKEFNVTGRPFSWSSP